MAQQDLFGNVAAAPVNYAPEPGDVRAKLHLVLSQAKAAPATPWREKDREFYRVVFPQMTNWLPDDEAKQLRFEFETELARLEAA
jgi:hypothetical protein